MPEKTSIITLFLFVISINVVHFSVTAQVSKNPISPLNDSVKKAAYTPLPVPTWKPVKDAASLNFAFNENRLKNVSIRNMPFLNVQQLKHLPAVLSKDTLMAAFWRNWLHERSLEDY